MTAPSSIPVRDPRVAEFRAAARALVVAPVEADDDSVASLLREIGPDEEALRIAVSLTLTHPVPAIVRALRDPDARPGGTRIARLFEMGRDDFRRADDDTARAWAALAAFAGAFDGEQAVGVLAACDLPDPEGSLLRLVAAGVLTWTTLDERPALLLPGVYRAAGRGGLDADVSLAADARRGLLVWWVSAAARFEEGAAVEQADLVRGIGAQLPDLEAALAQGRFDDPAAVIEVVVSLLPLWFATSRTEFAAHQLDAVLRTGGMDAPHRFQALYGLALIETASDLTAAEARIGQAEALGLDDPRARARVRRVRAFCALYREDVARAAALAEEASADRDAEAAITATHELAVDLEWQAAAASLAGDPVRAARLAERAAALCDRGGDSLLRGNVLWAFAFAAWRDGDRHRACLLALDGIESADAAGNRYAAAQCLEVVAWHEGAEGEPERAARLLGVADALRADIGIATVKWGMAPHHEQAVDAARTALGTARFWRVFRAARGSSLADTTRWLGLHGRTGEQALLTRRQHEIVALIVGGSANKEIAALLGISVSTVENHVRAIFGRLGAVSRAQVAAWGARHDPGSRAPRARRPA